MDFLEAVEGKAVDYDFTRDVGLIRIRPGRQLPASRVVPAHWEPQSRMSMLTVGCSEGEDATAWPTAIIGREDRISCREDRTYEAIECLKAPKQGRSGGGLFTDNGYIAGVCDFAEPQGDHGLYATPRSIYSLLDRNNLTALYAPPTRGSGTLVADRRSGSRPQPAAAKPFARSQSPDREEPARGRAGADDSAAMRHDPAPHLPGDRCPGGPAAERTPRAASTTRRTNWRPTRKPAASKRRPFRRGSTIRPSDEPILRKTKATARTELPVQMPTQRRLAIETAMASRQTRRRSVPPAADYRDLI